ncbi:MAG: cytochrome c peroxidase [Planctomycetota bacterium]
MRKAPGLALAVGVCIWASGARGQNPGVPSLPSTSFDYVGYAVENLPSWYDTPQLRNANNTPADNPITNAGAELGRVLFYDPRLSHNDGTSCASCHVQANGFSDPNQLSIGFDGGLTGRHSMGLSNAVFYRPGSFFWDERADTLEAQVLMPIQDQVEMGSTLEQLTGENSGSPGELGQTEFYPELFARAFGDSQITSERMAQAMAQFVRSMVTYQSRFDQALAADDLGDVLNTDELAGHALFANRCAGCHRTDAQIANTTHNIGLDAVDTDAGAGDGEFKVPSLRNVAVRDGFMHDGRFQTLEEVIEFYSTGVQDNANLSPGMQVGGFGFTEQQQQQLLAFLNTLTDEAFLSSELFSDPFVQLAGDYNGDGVVDADDFQVWLTTVGSTEGDTDGLLWADGNLDGVVDQADYAVWRNNLGARWDDGLAPLGLAAVPEPGSLALLAAGVGLAWPRRKRLPCTQDADAPPG